jgi:D-amino-acid dehydrogenase
MKRICILGAGIVGLAAARALQEQGHEVTVVDAGEPGGGASGANGAQLSFAYVQPLADPGIWAQLPTLLFSRHSPLQLRPRWDLHQWRWGLAFLLACTRHASARTTRQLLQLAAESRAAFDQLRQEQALACDWRASGKLVLYRDQRSFASARRQLALQRSLGVDQWAVDPGECLRIEPALAQDEGRLTGAIYTPGECVADCALTCAELVRILQRDGAAFALRQPAVGLVMRGPRAVAVRTAAGEIAADAVVAALGSASHAFSRAIGCRLPVYPLKGYSITAPASHFAPEVSVTDASRKLVFARVGDRLRVAGLAEMGGAPDSVPPARIERLLHEARQVFPRAADYSLAKPWSGLRPATPGGAPLLGAHPRGPANVFFNTGHGALGFTLAFGSAQRLARLIRAAAAPA